MKDRNGTEIKDGCKIFNINEPERLYLIVKNEKDELCFEEDMEVLTKRYCLDEFWEIKL